MKKTLSFVALIGLVLNVGGFHVHADEGAVAALKQAKPIRSKRDQMVEGVKAFIDTNRLDYAQKLKALKNQRSGLLCPINPVVKAPNVPRPETLIIHVERTEPKVQPLPGNRNNYVLRNIGQVSISGGSLRALNRSAPTFAQNTTTAQVLGLPTSVRPVIKGSVQEWLDNKCIKTTVKPPSAGGSLRQRTTTEQQATKTLHRLIPVDDLLAAVPDGWSYPNIRQQGFAQTEDSRIQWFRKKPADKAKIRSQFAYDPKPFNPECDFTQDSATQTTLDHTFDLSKVQGVRLRNIELLDGNKALSDDHYSIPVQLDTGRILAESAPSLRVNLLLSDGEKSHSLPASIGNVQLDYQRASFIPRLQGNQLHFDYVGGTEPLKLTIRLAGGNEQSPTRTLTVIPVSYRIATQPNATGRADGEQMLINAGEYQVQVINAARNAQALSSSKQSSVRFRLENVSANLRVELGSAEKGFRRSNGQLVASTTVKATRIRMTNRLRKAIRAGQAITNGGESFKVIAEVLDANSRIIGQFEQTYRVGLPSLSSATLRLVGEQASSDKNGVLDVFYPNTLSNQIKVFADLQFEQNLAMPNQQLTTDDASGLKWIKTFFAGPNILRLPPKKSVFNKGSLSPLGNGFGEVALGARIDQLELFAGMNMVFSNILQMSMQTNQLSIRINELIVKKVLGRNGPELRLTMRGPTEARGYKTQWQFASGKTLDSTFDEQQGNWTSLLDLREFDPKDTVKSITLLDSQGVTRAVLNEELLGLSATNAQLTLLAPKDLSQNVIQPLVAVIRNLPQNLWTETVCRWQFNADSNHLGVLANAETPVEMRRESLGRCRNELMFAPSLENAGNFAGLSVQLIHKGND